MLPDAAWQALPNPYFWGATMAFDTILISHVSGKAWMRNADGPLIALHEGMRVPVNAHILTDEGASVTLQAAGVPPVIVGQNTNMLVTDDLASAQPQPADNAAMSPIDAVTSPVLAALDAGQDPFDLMEPTAAVLAGGESGGASFTRLSSVHETVSPLSLAYPRLGVETPELVLLSGTALGTPAEISVRLPTPETGPVTDPGTTLPVVRIEFITGDGVVSESGLPEGTNAEDPSVLTTSGRLIITGTDQVGEVQVYLQDGKWHTVHSGDVFGNADHGKLTFTQGSDGTWFWSYTLEGPVQHHTPGAIGVDDQVFDLFQVRVSNSAGNWSVPDALNVAINDDGPVFLLVHHAEEGSIVMLSALNPGAGTVYTGQFVDWKYGADGFDSITATMLSSKGEKSVEVGAIATDGSQIVLNLKDGDWVVAHLTLNANGTDTLEVLHRDSPLDFTGVAGTAVPEGPELEKRVNLEGAFDIILSSANGEVFANTHGWGVGNSQVDPGEALLFQFVDSGHTTAYGAGDFKFSVSDAQHSGGPGKYVEDLVVRVYLDAGRTIWDEITVKDVYEGTKIQISQLDWTNKGVQGNYNVGDTIYAVEIGNGDDSSGWFRLNDIEVGTRSNPLDLDFSGIQITITDRDGDTATQVFDVHLRGEPGHSLDMEIIAGSAGIDTLASTAGTGHLADDAFTWALADLDTTNAPRVDHVTHFGTVSGSGPGKDVLDLSDLLQGHDHGATPGDHSDLAQYLHISGDGSKTFIDVKVNADGTVADHVTQQIVIDDIDLTAGHGHDTQAQLIDSLINNGKLKVDQS